MCPCCQFFRDRHGNKSSACLMMWLMAASLFLTMWWRPGGVRGPSCWSCKPTMGVHHAYTTYNARGYACTWIRSFDPGPCYCPWPIHPSGGSPARPKFKACKQVTQHPLVGQVNIFHGRLGWTGSLRVCVCVCACVCMCTLCVAILWCSYIWDIARISLNMLFIIFPVQYTIIPLGTC